MVRVRLLVLAVLCLVSVILLYLGLAPLSLAHDKFLHFCGFFVLSVLFYWVFELSRRQATQLTFLVVCVVFSVFSEIFQALFSSRKFDPFDIVFNIVGASCGLVFNFFFHGYLLKHKRNSRYSRLQQIADEENQYELNDVL